MSTRISKVEVYAADLRNQPGMLARVLEALANAGADLEFIVARRVTGNTARVFMAPLKGARQLRAAADVDVRRAAGMHALRIEAADRPGFGAALTRRL
ncbi:MAG: ACT domain-containing protein, partial [Phycisphaerae bacterium]|nr:ACT domain-containing protein [Phycisphaerae bacterium]